MQTLNYKLLIEESTWAMICTFINLLHNIENWDLANKLYFVFLIMKLLYTLIDKNNQTNIKIILAKKDSARE